MKRGITLVEVPYWWDRTIESPAATIHQARSELISLPPEAKPIPTNFGAATTGNSHTLFLSNGHFWDGSEQITGWYKAVKL